MSKDVVYCIGIDEKLLGLENKILACMPIIIFEDDTIAVVRYLDWNSTKNALKIIKNNSELEEYATIFHDNRKYKIHNNELVILIGSSFYQIAKDLNITSQIPLLNNLNFINYNFAIYISEQKVYEDLKYDIFCYAKAKFDAELENSNCEIVSSSAQKALDILYGLPFLNFEDIIVRVIASSYIKSDSDQYRTDIELAALDLERPKEDIEKWVKDFLNDRQRNSKRKLFYSEETDLVPYRQVSYDDVSLAEYLDKNGKIDPEISYRLINTLWELNRNLNGNFNEWWETELVKAFASGHKEYKLALAHALKARTYILAENKWVNWDNNWFDLLPVFESLRGKAISISNKYAQRISLGSIVYGISQFPESRIYGEICNQIFNEPNRLININNKELTYGQTYINEYDDADIVLINERALDDTDAQNYKSIFSHNGYYIFINKNIIEQILDKEIPKPVYQLCQRILDLDDSPEKDDEEELCARCWIAANSGLTSYSFKEYNILIEDIINYAKNIGDFDFNISTRKRIEFDFDFEQFILGDKSIFLGGSVHARLLINWWNRYIDHFYLILGPDHFARISQKGKWPPENKLVFGSRISPAGDKNRKNFQRSFISLFQDISNFIKDIAQESKANDQSNSRKYIYYLMRKLSENKIEKRMLNDPWRWSFVADIESMHDLLLIDNSFDISNLR